MEQVAMSPCHRAFLCGRNWYLSERTFLWAADSAPRPPPSVDLIICTQTLGSKSYTSVLNTCECTSAVTLTGLPKCSVLFAHSVQKKIHTLSEGYIGDIAEVV